MTSTRIVRPQHLTPGARVALAAPAGVVLEQDDLDRSAELCRTLGLEPVPQPNAGRRLGYLAGTDQERLSDLQQALGDPSFAAVWCIRGGVGTTRLLDRIDFSSLAAAPKILLGFSDITALLLAAFHHTRLVTFHGPVARNPLSAFSRAHLERLLFDPSPAGPLALPPPAAGVLVPREPRVVTLRAGVAAGPLLGGNLSLIQCLVGTPHLPAFDEGILFLEDVGEELYRIDRTLAHLRSARVLDRIAGVAVGQFTGMKRGPAEPGRSLDDVLDDYFGFHSIPVVRGLPIGHVDDQWTLPIGVRARLDATARTLELLEAGTS